MSLSLVLGWFGFYFLEKDKKEISYVSNPSLTYDKTPQEWKGTPRLSDGTYQNIDYPFTSSFLDVLKWKLTRNPQAEVKKTYSKKLEIEPISNPNNRTVDQLIWLGHASFLIQIDGITIVTDPVWVDNWALKRKSDIPSNLMKIKEVDYILISHDHRDHCDETTLKILAKSFPKAQVLTGLNMQTLIKKWIPNIIVQEAGWYQNYDLLNSLKITFVPARHWSRRGLMDQNHRLWGGFYIQTASKSIYFMGDSGFGPHFKEISNTLGPPDYALMGIGAFKPEWFMSQSHTSPEQASKAFREMKAKHFLPMHFGTFDLSDELLLEPLDWLIAHPDSVFHQLINPILGKNLFF